MSLDPPNPAAECDRPLNPADHAMFRGLLRDCYGDALEVDGRQGEGAVLLTVVHGPDDKAYEIFVFARGDDAQNVAIDYLDGVLEEIIGKGHNPEAGFHLPTEWAVREYDEHRVWVRGEVRDYLAEEAAALAGSAPSRARAIKKAEPASAHAGLTVLDE